MYTEKFTALMNDKEFVIKMLSQESAEAVRKLFAESGVELTMDEVHALGAELAKLDQPEQPEGELSAEALENVSGGVVEWLLVAKAVVAIGGAGVALYKWYKSR